MLRKTAAAGLLIGFALAGCSQPKPVIVHEAMAQVIAPQTQVLWDISNKSLNDNGDPDPKKLTTDDWNQLVTASQQVRDRARQLAEAKSYQVVEPGAKILDQGTSGGSSPEQVQGFIDKDPKTFAQRSADLAAAADEALAAANAKDPVKLNAVSNRLDQVCETCHVKFWYPNQKIPQ